MFSLLAIAATAISIKSAAILTAAGAAGYVVGSKSSKK